MQRGGGRLGTKKNPRVAVLFYHHLRSLAWQVFGKHVRGFDAGGGGEKGTKQEKGVGSFGENRDPSLICSLY